MSDNMGRLKSIYREFTSFEGSLFRYSLSFSLLLALAPSVLILAMLFRYAFLPMDIIMNFVMNFMPSADVQVLDQIFLFFTNQDYSIASFIVTMSVSFYLASRSIYSFLLINAAHEGVDIPKWSIRVKSIVMFLVLIATLILSIYIGTKLIQYLPIVASVIMLLLMTIMYRSLSFKKRHWSYGIIGAMFSTICIMLLAALFITIVNQFTSYKDVYGPLASLVTLLLAIYLISCIIYFGYCLNIVCEDVYGREKELPLKHEKFFMACKKLTKILRK